MSQPGYYVKGDKVRLASTAKDAVQAEWEGYTLDQSDEDLEPTENASSQTPELPSEGQSGTEDSTSFDATPTE